MLNLSGPKSTILGLIAASQDLFNLSIFAILRLSSQELHPDYSSQILDGQWKPLA